MRPSLRSCRWQSSAPVARAPTRFRAQPRPSPAARAGSGCPRRRHQSRRRRLEAVQPTETPRIGRLKVRWTADTITGGESVSDVVGVGLSFRHIRPRRRAAVHRGSDARYAACAFAGRARLGAGPCIPRSCPSPFSAVAGGPGFVASGWTEGRALVWTSADGRHWQEIEDPQSWRRSDQSTPRHRQRPRRLRLDPGDDTEASGPRRTGLTGSPRRTIRALRSRGACTLPPRYDGRAIAIVSRQTRRSRIGLGDEGPRRVGTRRPAP